MSICKIGHHLWESDLNFLICSWLASPKKRLFFWLVPRCHSPETLVRPASIRGASVHLRCLGVPWGSAVARQGANWIPGSRKMFRPCSFKWLSYNELTMVKYGLIRDNNPLTMLENGIVINDNGMIIDYPLHQTRLAGDFPQTQWRVW